MARRGTVVVLALALVATAVAMLPPVREPLLRGVGHALVVDEPVSPSAVVVISVDAGLAGVLEAADLVAAGFARDVVLYAPQRRAEEQALLERGVPYEDAAARHRAVLASLGVTRLLAVERVSGTAEQAKALAAWCRRQRVASIIVVASPDHSRRLRRVLRRAMQDADTRVSVRATRHGGFDADTWWHSRAGTRQALIELQKLLLDVAAHPIP